MTGPVPSAILNPHLVQDRFRLDRHAPSPDLAWAIERYWTVAWDLTGRPPHVQETLAVPCVNLVFEAGATAVFGIMRGRVERRLSGKGRAFGVKFRPGGFQPLLGGAVSRLTGTSLTLRQVFGETGDIEGRLLAVAGDAARAVAAIEPFLRARLPSPDPSVVRIGGLVDRIAADRSILRVDDLAAIAGVGTRALQRSFNRYVGIGPKWVIARYRLHEAAERLAGGGPVDLARMAQDLGYFDQSHFIRDFRRLVGRAPGDYVRAVAERPRPALNPPPGSGM